MLADAPQCGYLCLASWGNGALGHWSITFLSRLLLVPVSSAGGFMVCTVLGTHLIFVGELHLA